MNDAVTQPTVLEIPRDRDRDARIESTLQAEISKLKGNYLALALSRDGLVEVLRASLAPLLIASEYLREAGKATEANNVLEIERKARVALAKVTSAQRSGS